MAYALQGSTGMWEVVVGLEVHAQIVSNAKLFSGAATAFGAIKRINLAAVVDQYEVGLLTDGTVQRAVNLTDAGFVLQPIGGLG